MLYFAALARDGLWLIDADGFSRSRLQFASQLGRSRTRSIAAGPRRSTCFWLQISDAHNRLVRDIALATSPWQHAIGMTLLDALKINMTKTSAQLRAELSFRIRMGAPSEWNEFSQLWMSFNAMYGGEVDAKERSRVMSCIRRYLSERTAQRVLRQITKSVDQILDIPPGNLLLNRWDPKFRAASLRCAALYKNKSESAVGRLAGVAGVLYQVRCNLIHGSKDPRNERDRMLVRESLSILRALIPELEAALI